MNSCHRIRYTFAINLTGHRESIFAMMLSARAIASEIADSDAGEFLPSHYVNCRPATMQAAIRITHFLPSSSIMSVACSPFVRHNEFAFLSATSGNLHSGFRNIPVGGEPSQKVIVVVTVIK
jgi:hypothetical protein